MCCTAISACGFAPGLIWAKQMAVSAAGALLFAGFSLFDTRRQVGGEEDSYVMAAVRMYLNVLNVVCAP